MQIEGWKYYNHAMLPTSEPHEIPDMRPIESGDIWNAGGVLLYLQGGQPIGIAAMRRTGGM